MAAGLTEPIVVLGTVYFDTRVTSQIIATILPKSVALLVPVILPFMVREAKCLRQVLLEFVAKASVNDVRSEGDESDDAFASESV